MQPVKRKANPKAKANAKKGAKKKLKSAKKTNGGKKAQHTNITGGISFSFSMLLLYIINSVYQ